MPKNLITTALAMLTLCACSSGASLVRKDAISGRIRLDGAYMPAMADARLLMVEHCNGRYAALESGNTLDFRCQAPDARPKTRGTELALQATVASR
jgi:hypothetical protein